MLHLPPILLSLVPAIRDYWRAHITKLSTPSCTSKHSPRHIVLKHAQPVTRSILRARDQEEESDTPPVKSGRPISHTLTSRLLCVKNSLCNLFIYLFSALAFHCPSRSIGAMADVVIDMEDIPRYIPCSFVCFYECVGSYVSNSDTWFWWSKIHFLNAKMWQVYALFVSV